LLTLFPQEFSLFLGEQEQMTATLTVAIKSPTSLYSKVVV
jgi:hypothetical protein